MHDASVGQMKSNTLSFFKQCLSLVSQPTPTKSELLCQFSDKDIAIKLLYQVKPVVCLRRWKNRIIIFGERNIITNFFILFISNIAFIRWGTNYIEFAFSLPNNYSFCDRRANTTFAFSFQANCFISRTVNT